MYHIIFEPPWTTTKQIFIVDVCHIEVLTSTFASKPIFPSTTTTSRPKLFRYRTTYREIIRTFINIDHSSHSHYPQN